MLTSEVLSTQHGYLLLEEVAALKELARGLPSIPRVVGIGAGVGTSGLAFLEARADLRLYSVDNVGTSLAAEEQTFMAAGIHSQNRYVQILGDSHVVGREWIQRGFHRVEMIFIDDGHTYEEVKGDIEVWLPNLLPDGVIAFHDYRNDWDIGVSQAVDKGMAGHEEIARTAGLIVFRIKP